MVEERFIEDPKTDDIPTEFEIDLPLLEPEESEEDLLRLLSSK